MNLKAILIAFLVGLALMKYAGTETKVIPVGKLDMKQVFGASTSDAKRAAAFFYSLADTIEWDSHTDKPKLTSDLDIVNYRVDALTFATRGWGFDSKFPDFGKQVGGYLDTTVGAEPVKSFDESRRQVWVKAWREIGDSCASAGKGIF